MRYPALVEAAPLRRTVRFASDDEMVAARMRTACESMRVAEVARLTDTPAETVRRYMAGHAASVGFLIRFCEATDTSADWLLLGRGPQRQSQAVHEYLTRASAHELCAALAGRIDRPARRPVDHPPRLVVEDAG